MKDAENKEELELAVAQGLELNVDDIHAASFTERRLRQVSREIRAAHKGAVAGSAFMLGSIAELFASVSMSSPEMLLASYASAGLGVMFSLASDNREKLVKRQAKREIAAGGAVSPLSLNIS